MTNRKPLIGLTPLVDEARDSYWMLRGYMDCIQMLGGVPMMLPLTNDKGAIDRLLDAMDGFLFTGGPDIDPSIYVQNPLAECGEIAHQRDALETKLLPKALERGKSVLGICRGMQLINAVLGGTLFQDLPTQHPSSITHRMDAPYDRAWHEVSLKEGSPLQRLLDVKTLGVNSCHHQAVFDLAPGMEAMAFSPDGLIEAIYMPNRKFVWGVQWHPEFSYKVDSNSVKIMEAFVVSMCD